MNTEFMRQLVDAKAKRDTVRALLIKALRETADLPPEINALLLADQQATESLREVLS